MKVMIWRINGGLCSKNCIESKLILKLDVNSLLDFFQKEIKWKLIFRWNSINKIWRKNYWDKISAKKVETKMLIKLVNGK